MLYHFQDYFKKIALTSERLDYGQLENVKSLITDTRDAAKTIYLFGNGGSGANASHIAGDYVKGASYKQDKKFKFICLNDNYSAMAAISNDISYDEVFCMQLENFVQQGDLVIGLSGSGNSENVVRALRLAKQKKAVTIAVTAYTGGRMKEMADHSLHIPINDMEIAEDFQLMLFHTIKQAIITEGKGSPEDMGEKYTRRLSGDDH